MTLNVFRVARLPEQESRLVSFGHSLDVFDQTRGWTDGDNEYAGCQRIERARVANFMRLREALHTIDHIARGAPGWLIDIE